MRRLYGADNPAPAPPNPQRAVLSRTVARQQNQRSLPAACSEATSPTGRGLTHARPPWRVPTAPAYVHCPSRRVAPAPHASRGRSEQRRKGWGMTPQSARAGRRRNPPSTMTPATIVKNDLPFDLLLRTSADLSVALGATAPYAFMADSYFRSGSAKPI